MKMENIITGIAISIILPIVYGFFYHLKEKEEKKITYGTEFTVKMSKGITIFFFISLSINLKSPRFILLFFYCNLMLYIIIIISLEEKR